jgi:hypothetical protein
MNRQKIQELEKRKTKIGLVGTKLEVTNDLPGNSFSACIKNDWEKIRMDYQKDLDLVPDKETEHFVKKMGIVDAEMKIGEDILDHECGHRENRARTTLGCPYDVITHDGIKSEVARALDAKGKKDKTSYVTNAFEDVLDNINCRNHTDFAGQTLFWNNQGLVKSKNQKYNPFYEAFVRMNLFLGGEVKSHSLLSRFYSEDERILPVVKGFLEDLCSQTDEESPIGFNRKPGFNRLFTTDLKQRRALWERLAFSFADKTAEFLDDIPEEKMFGHGEGAEGPSDPREGEGENPFDGEMKDPSVQEKIAMERYNSGKGPSYHTDLQEQLYSFYKATSRDIKIETSSFSSSQSMPLVHFGKRFVNENDRKIRFRGIGVDSEGRLGIKTSRYALDFPATYKKHPTQFPNLKIAIMDRSGSMSASANGEGVGDTSFVPWGNNSKYHFALKGYFGIDNYLERQGVAPFMDCSVVGLSGEAVMRGKSKEVAKKLLHSPEGSYTSLDVSQLEKELNKTALVMSISDGEVRLPEDTSGLDEKLKNCDYVHIQIGKRNRYSDYVEGLGKPVLFVRGDKDLSQAMVSFVSKYYHDKGQEANK